MNAPASIVPPYRHTPLFPLGQDAAPYRKLGAAGVRVEKLMGREMIVVEREALRALAEAAFGDINHLLRPGHLAQLRDILLDPEASPNDKFVAYDFLKNANIAAGGVLPMCQDTGTVIIMGKKGRLVFTDGDDEAALAEGARDSYLKRNLRYSQLAPVSMFEEKNTRSNMRRRSRSMRTARAARTPTNSCSSPRAAAPPTSRSCSRRRPRSSPTTACWPSSRRRF